MLAQAVRHAIYAQTKDIRRLTVARALASTVIEDVPEDEITENDSNTDINNILTDWFESNA